MKKNLKNRIALIIAVLLVFLYGIFGIPSGVSGKALLEAMSSRIHLGLDLSGGAHLILQVEVRKRSTPKPTTPWRAIQQDLKTANLSFSQVYKPDPLKPDEIGKPEVIEWKACRRRKSSAVRSMLDQKYSNEYDITGGGTDNSFTLTMKPLVEKALDEKTVQQAIETIRDRVDSLGVSEPLIQEYSLGANQILVELPGISDLDQVKSIIQSTARLEIHAVVGGPYQDEAAALASVGGALPPDEKMVHGSGALATGSDAGQRLCAAAHRHRGRQRLPLRRPGHGSNTGQRDVRFTLTNEAGDKFYDYTSANVGKSMAVVMGGRVREVANIKSAIRDSGEIRRQLLSG